MTRATQTGDIVHAHFPGTKIHACDLLREAAVCPPEPPVGKPPVLYPVLRIRVPVLFYPPDPGSGMEQ
jgi:hypothetical protein